MALKVIEAKVKKRQYRSTEEIRQDMKLVRDNCYKYPLAALSAYMSSSHCSTRARGMRPGSKRACRYCKKNYPQLLPVADELICFVDSEIERLRPQASGPFVSGQRYSQIE
jgi:hypothetical protein